eukprot:Gregarina_sp_Poly_1__6899@NODE_3742_length_900_cov_756_088836_g2400_i0_p1_GENE_NODE_3742_length_900_cov_756_088836_g2400_i0NODE_3742_length_900_cov_756_088836_g2400_i0_p1_ORF_typecomplete_len292_score26_18Zip/PF02535_22/1_7e03Zip/PF02535_22/2e08DUF1980/PF09323_10/0_12OATP/PF03137_20/1_5e03OATP/PF03137_20/0_14_NODE_3742_length_900_cov_756_088836_g2400_i025789
MAGVFPTASSSLLLKGLIVAAGCCMIPCAQGNSVELHRSNSIFRGATDISERFVTANEALTGGVDSVRIKNLRSLVDISPEHVSEVQSLLFADALSQSSPDFRHFDHAHDHELTASRIWNVIGAVLMILAVTVLGVFLPYIMQRVFGTSQRRIAGLVLESLCTAFAAGGFWGLAIIHVFLESLASLEALDFGLHLGESFMNAAYPLVCVGYVSMLGVEALAKVLSKSELPNISLQKTATHRSGHSAEQASLCED